MVRGLPWEERVECRPSKVGRVVPEDREPEEPVHLLGKEERAERVARRHRRKVVPEDRVPEEPVHRLGKGVPEERVARRHQRKEVREDRVWVEQVHRP